MVQITLASQLRPGTSMSPRECYLPLLPSGPDGVRSSPSHRTQTSSPLGKKQLCTSKSQAGIQPRYSGFRVQGTASSPPSTTYLKCYQQQLISSRLICRFFPSCNLALETRNRIITALLLVMRFLTISTSVAISISGEHGDTN